MPASRVVIVEDADPIRLSVQAALTAHGYDTVASSDGEGLESLLAEHPPELVILDVMLPGRDGLELLALVRARSTAGVLLLTARDATADRVDGLARGADDYLVKPFAMAELLARVQAILRRVGISGPSIAVGDLEIADGGAQVRRAGVPLELTDTERRLLVYLAGQRGRTVTKTQLLTGVWGYDGFDPNVVEVHVSALRRKIEVYGPRLIHTVRGRGYRLADAP
ncbi:MAG: response regulator transcription factor [Actinomycetota bacterium]|nr:response regulator transcription factor [Actinomycetota bacterium]